VLILLIVGNCRIILGKRVDFKSNNIIISGEMALYPSGTTLVRDGGQLEFIIIMIVA
jgi:hypothetical protein